MGAANMEFYEMARQLTHNNFLHKLGTHLCYDAIDNPLKNPYT